MPCAPTRSGETLDKFADWKEKRITCINSSEVKCQGIEQLFHETCCDYSSIQPYIWCPDRWELSPFGFFPSVFADGIMEIPSSWCLLCLFLLLQLLHYLFPPPFNFTVEEIDKLSSDSLWFSLNFSLHERNRICSESASSGTRQSSSPGHVPKW